MTDGSENLIPFSERSEDEVREMNRNGGIKSGEVRRKKAAMKDVAAMVLGLKPLLSEKNLEYFKAIGIDPAEVTMQTLALVKQNERAILGNLAALQFLRDTAGEKPQDNIGITGDFMGDFEIIVGRKNDSDDQTET